MDVEVGEQREGETVSLHHLPEDVIYQIIFYCDLQSLGRLAAVCKRLAHLVRQECVWISVSRRLTLVYDSCQRCDQLDSRGLGRPQRVRPQEMCRRAVNWRRGHGRDVRVIHHNVKQMPWLEKDERCLWVSYKNIVRCYERRRQGHLVERAGVRMEATPADDICRFVTKQGCLLAGSRDGSICCFNTGDGSPVWDVEHAHISDVQAVDFFDHVAISGSRDATIKLWDMTCEAEGPLVTLPVNDRVWSLAMNPDGGSFVSGTAGINYVPPLRVWDAHTMELLGNLGEHYKNGAGVLDIQFETPDTLLSCGYDTFIRLWDRRCSLAKCVLRWEEPFDSTIYCVRTDGQNAVMSGTARYGMVRLWDKRMTEPVQMYYTGRSSSPVYSLAFDTARLYVALDKGIHVVDFSIR